MSGVFLYLRFVSKPPEDIFDMIRITIEGIRHALSGNQVQDAQELLDLVHQLAETNPDIFYRSKENLLILLADITKSSSEVFDGHDLQVVALEILTELVGSRKTSFYRDSGIELMKLSVSLMSAVGDDDQEGYNC